MLKNKTQNLTEGAFILLATAILTKLIGALFKIPLASNFCLGDLGFGYFSTAYDFLGAVIVLSVSGLPIAVSKLISENPSNADGIFKASRGLFLWLGGIITAIAVVMLLVLRFLGAIEKYSLLCFLAIMPSLLFGCISSAYRGYFEGKTNMLTPAFSSLIEALSKLILGFGLAFLAVKLTEKVALGAAMALWGISIGSVLSAIYLHFSLGVKKLKSDTSAFELKKIALTAIPIALFSFSGNAMGLVDSITVPVGLSHLFETDFNYFQNMYSEAINEFNGISSTSLNINDLHTFLYGIRSKAYTLYNIIPTFVAFLGVSAVPHISAAFKSGEKKEASANSIKALKYASVLAIPTGIGFIALNQKIIALLYGNGVSAQIGGKMLILFGAATAFSGVAIVLGNILQAIGKQNIALFDLLTGFLLKIILNISLCRIKSLNIYGSAIATAVSYGLIFILNLIFVSRELEIKKEIFTIFLKLLISAVSCGFSAFLISSFGNSSLVTLISIACGGIVYLIFVAILKVFSENELAELPLVGKIFDK